MKKQVAFFLLFLSLTLSAQKGQNINNSNLIQKIDSLENRVIELENLAAENSVQIKAKIDSLQLNSAEDSKKEYQEQIISEYESVVSLFTTGFTILLGLFGLVFPLLLYLIQVKPSLETIKEAKNLLTKIDDDFEKSFESHLKKNRVKLVDEAISNYENEKTPFLSSSYSTINTYKNEGFTQLQVIRLIKLIKRKSDDDNRDFFARMLTFQEDTNTEDFFTELIKSNPKDKICIWGALYFATYDKTDKIDLIADVVINGYSLAGMISSLYSSSKKFCPLLLNNEKLVNELDGTELNNYLEYGIENFIEKFDESTAKSTLIWSKKKE